MRPSHKSERITAVAGHKPLHTPQPHASTLAQHKHLGPRSDRSNDLLLIDAVRVDLGIQPDDFCGAAAMSVPEPPLDRRDDIQRISPQLSPHELTLTDDFRESLFGDRLCDDIEDPFRSKTVECDRDGFLVIPEMVERRPEDDTIEAPMCAQIVRGVGRDGDDRRLDVGEHRRGHIDGGHMAATFSEQATEKARPGAAVSYQRSSRETHEREVRIEVGHVLGKEVVTSSICRVIGGVLLVPHAVGLNDSLAHVRILSASVQVRA